MSTKSTPTDVVTASDTALETLVRERLAQLRPGDPVVGEEGGGSAVDGAVTWVVDPIDGTVNFLYGLPWYAVSLAATRDGVSLAGAVAEPASGRLWSAARGAGATCDGRPLRCSAETDLAMTMVGTGFAYPRSAGRARPRSSGGCCRRCATCAGAGRRRWTCAPWRPAGSTPTSSTARNWWDWAAAALIAEEAGAVVRVPARPGLPPPTTDWARTCSSRRRPGWPPGSPRLAAELGAAEI